MAEKKKIFSIVASAIGGISVSIPIFQFATGVNSLPEAFDKDNKTADKQQVILYDNSNDEDNTEINYQISSNDDKPELNNPNNSSSLKDDNKSNEKNGNNSNEIMDNTVSSSDEVVVGNLGTDISWKLEGDVLTFSGSGEIPARGAFCEYYDLSDQVRSVVIEEGITRIGDVAFGDMPIESVSIPTTLTSIGHHAFSSTNLSSVIFPENTWLFSYNVFVNCPNLTAVYFYGDPLIDAEMFYDSPNVIVYVHSGSVTENVL